MVTKSAKTKTARKKKGETSATSRKKKKAEDSKSKEEEEKDDSKGLVFTGALSRYLAEVRRHPLLTREQEHNLAVALREENDEEAAAKMITSNLRLVVKIAMEYQRTFVNVLDLIQEGNIGLMQAVARFDPYKGVKLSSYASWWIKAYILRYILNNWRMVKVVTTQTQRKLFFNLQKEKERLETMGFRPTSKLIAESLSVPEKDVVEMDKRLSQGELSMDLPLSDDSKASLGDLVSKDGPLQDDLIAENEMARIYHGKLQEYENQLSDKELYIYHNRMLAEQPMTLQEIGEVFGITRERVRQIEARILANLRKFFEEQGLKAPG
jgi:RNA polymerase sigma-32 factor